ncbi:MAG: CARDB domain-containing protein [Candidatus Nitrotoga sp.]
MPTMAKIQTKTKTVVGIALAITTIGVAGFVAGLYYYGQRINYISSKNNCNCPTCQTCPKCDTAPETPPETPPATPPSSGNVDLVVTSFKHPGAIENDFSGGVTVANLGAGSAGQFKVKIYISYGKTPAGAQLLANGTQTVSGLATGQSVSLGFTNLSYSGLAIHTYYHLIAVVDADNEVAETNEGNNINSGDIELL